MLFLIRLFAGIANWVLVLPIALAEEARTPLAGEAFQTELFGVPVKVPARDRRHVTAVNFGVQWIPHGPNQLEVPFFFPVDTLFVPS